ncbi:MAG: Acyl-[acyl-carrier-protein]--UDP-N-acetylglucosamine O-acyltransferase [Turneriella sp.]|nr:Acyl-[acyl-carrier-protein]--UDP-N-acetylglucosamine O-acyltransferase [Turneriella sp.]
MPKIHPTAVVENPANLADDVVVHAMAYIGPEVKIGAGCEIGVRATVTNRVTLGKKNKLFTGACIGENAQDIHFDNPEAEIVIGDNNVFRETITVHQPALKGNKTTIGNGCYFMADAHVAHDCHVGNNVIMVNKSGIAGHVEVGDNALISGLVMVHQFVRVGAFAVIGGVSKATRDALPFTMNNGNPALAFGLNVVGLKRSGMTPAERSAIKQAFQIFYLKDLSPPKATEVIEKELLPSLPENSAEHTRIEYILTWLKNSKRGFTFHASKKHEVEDEIE